MGKYITKNVSLHQFYQRNCDFRFMRIVVSTKYPQHMFLGVSNTVFLNISNYLPHLELRNRSIQIVALTNFVVVSSVGIKRFDYIYIVKFRY